MSYKISILFCVAEMCSSDANTQHTSRHKHNTLALLWGESLTLMYLARQLHYLHTERQREGWRAKVEWKR